MYSAEDNDTDKYGKRRRQRSQFVRKVASLSLLVVIMVVVYVYRQKHPASGKLLQDTRVLEMGTESREMHVEETEDDENFVSGSSPELYLPPLQPGQVMQFMKHDRTLVSTYGTRVGVPPQLRKAILSYCDETGMTKLIRELLENPLESEETKPFKLGNDKWQADRPPTDTWNSNMHWIEPYDEHTQQSFLKVLAKGGFDQILNSIGTFFDADGLYIHSISIIAVSHAYGDSYLHHDFINTDGKGFNAIIPLINVENSPPELYVQDETNEETLYAVKYNYDTAVVTGDSFYHKTSPVDYDITKGEMRVSATVYFGDINEDNIYEFVGDTTPAEPEDTRETLLEKSGTHWSPQGNHLPQ